jgi:hypothetical protein
MFFVPKSTKISRHVIKALYSASLLEHSLFILYLNLVVTLVGVIIKIPIQSHVYVWIEAVPSSEEAASISSLSHMKPWVG